jgi:hypothetical protein
MHGTGRTLRLPKRCADARTVWLLLFVLALGLGLGRAPWWTAPLPALGVLALGFESTANEPENYDMHGFGTLLGIAGAVVCFVLWFVGWGIAWALDGPPRRDRRKRDDGASD